jgi:hypothetical protein
MNIEKVDVYNDIPKDGVNNEYPTPKYSFRQPCLQMIVGVRYTGKSFLTSKILAQAKKDKTFNRVYIITPSFKSNEAYFGQYINEEDVFEPTKDSIDNVIKCVEADRDEFEQYLEDMDMYKKYLKDMRKRSITNIDGEVLVSYHSLGYLDGRKPEWKYDKVEPPKSLLILDDCLASPAISQSSGLTRISTLNRHIACLKTPHSGRSACGLAVIILSQTYRCQGGVGISRILRENLSLLTLFLNKQEKQLQAIKEELANVVDEELFDEAYKYATKEKYGSLTTDFKPKCPTLTFRKNLNQFIKFPQLGCTCNENKK